jgi:hypothetical protein
MRLPITLFSLIAAGLVGGIQSASAQSPYAYPWCSKSVRDGVLRCRYTSWEQCHTRTGVGGVCTRSPYYYSTPPDAPAPPGRRRRE